MTFQSDDAGFSWRNLWADLLKGAGRALLEYDGSRAAHAALAGLEVFEEAQKRRKRPDQQELGRDPFEGVVLNLEPLLSPEGWAEGASATAPWPEFQTPSSARQFPYAGQPIPISPLDGWHLQSAIPFGADGRLNLPIRRR
jgi:hypothetical protein